MTVIQTDTLTLNCHVCKSPVTGNDGYICVDTAAVYKRRQLIKEWEHGDGVEDVGWGTMISGAALLNYPAAVPWHTYHRDCDPNIDSGNGYWFYASRASTALDLLGWTAHLLGKKWFKDTNWDNFLYSVLSSNGWRDR